MYAKYVKKHSEIKSTYIQALKDTLFSDNEFIIYKKASSFRA